MLTLMDKPVKLPVARCLVWSTREGVERDRKEGIGIEFGDGDAPITAKIENYCVGLSDIGEVQSFVLSWQTPRKKAGPMGPVVIDF